MACAALEKELESPVPPSLYHSDSGLVRSSPCEEGDWIDLKYSFGDTLALSFAGKLMGFSGLSPPSEEADRTRPRQD